MDFNTAMKPLMVFSRLYGLAPYSVDNIGHSTFYRQSRSATIYSVAFCICLGFMVLAMSGHIQSITDAYRSPTIDVAHILTWICQSTTFVLVRIMCHVNRGKLLHVFSQISYLCVVFDVQPSVYKTFRLSIIMQIALFNVAHFVAFTLTACSYKDDFSWAPLWIFIFIFTLSNVTPELMFNNLILITGQLFKAVSTKLSNYSREVNGCASDTKLFNKSNEAGCYDEGKRSGSNLNMVKTFQGGRLPVFHNPDTPVHTIQIVGPSYREEDHFDAAELHSSLYEVSVLVNSLFGSQNLLGTASIALQMITSLFFFYNSSNGRDSGELNIRVAVASAISFSITALARLLFLVLSVSSTMSEAEELARTVSRLQSKAKTLRFRDQMQALSLQILHHKVQFSACGLFPLDATLITSIFGCVATYLVIVIQMVPPTSSNGSTSSTLCN